jgi:hypothetical protein
MPVRQQQTDSGHSGFVARGILVGHCGPWVCAPTRSAMRRLPASQLLMEGVSLGHSPNRPTRDIHRIGDPAEGF